jgi:hypothetical protein
LASWDSVAAPSPAIWVCGLDRDLVTRYGVSTKPLNEAVKRNAARFQEDFCSVSTPKRPPP